MTQDIRYAILSQLQLQPRQADATRIVTQKVLDTRLVRADELSHSTYQAALDKLKGQQFTYKLGERGDVIEFIGYDKRLGAVPVTRPGETGYMMTNVLDEDGWKELTHLSFLEPQEHLAPGQPWTREMAHDWAPLGSWSGVTTFTQDTTPGPDQHFRYTHDMTYTPSPKADDVLPFRVSGAEFRLVEAAGSFVYDPLARHVTQVQETFHVQGTVGADMLGEALSIEIEERQQVSIQLTVQNPWQSGDEAK